MNLFTNKKPIMGMVHCLPLPGTPNYKDNMEEIIERAIIDAITLEKAGVDAIIIENISDYPLGVELDFEQRIALTTVTTLVRQKVNIPIGIDAALNDYLAAIGIAKITGCNFVRIPVFVDTVVSSYGIIKPCARDAMYYRARINAEDILILADIQVKHTRLLIPDIPIEESAKMAVANGADAVIVTGVHTGIETPIDLIKRVKKVINVPVIAGSGINTNNISSQMEFVDGVIVGSSLKIDKNLLNPISKDLTEELIKEYRG